MSPAPEPLILKRLRVASDGDTAFDYWHLGSRVRWRGLFDCGDAREAPFALNEDYFEYLDLAEALDAAGPVFTMAELGAGYGRWCVTGGVAARRSGRMAKLIAVEADRRHFEMLQQHFSDNDLDPREHKLIYAPITGTRRRLYFTQGGPDEWWGQFILPRRPFNFLLVRIRAHRLLRRILGGDYGVSVDPADSITLADVLSGVAFVDLIHMDVQGAEAGIVEHGIDLLTAKVRRVHIGTHSAGIEETLRRVFSRAGWTCRFDYAGNGVRETGHGPVTFIDGVQSWINPKL